MKRPSKEKELWLINTSVDRDISVGDLRMTVRRGARVNLLSKQFTKEHIEASMQTGSIFKKRHVLAVREILPRRAALNLIKEVAKPRMLKPLRNPQQSTDAPYFKELDVEDEFMGMSEEQYAAEQADLESLDRQPALAVDKKFGPSKDLDDLAEE